MKIGILLCGDVPAELVDTFGSYTECLRAQLRLDECDSVTVWDLYQAGELPDDINQCDAYIVGGSPSGVHDGLDWVHRLSQFIRSAFFGRKKLFGICFGHQVINHALGGVVKRSEKGWGLGIYDVQLRQDIGSLKAGHNLQLIAVHQDQVIRPGQGFEVVAGNRFCPNYITRYKNQVLTVQGHPEFNGPFFNALLSHRTEKFKPEEIKKAQVTDDSLICNRRFNQFVNDFLAQPNTGY